MVRNSNIWTGHSVATLWTPHMPIFRRFFLGTKIGAKQLKGLGRNGPFGPPWIPKRPQGGPIWSIIMYYTCEKCFRTIWTLLDHHRVHMSVLAILGRNSQNQPSWKFFGGFPKKSIFHIEIWSKTCILVQYEQNLRWQFLGNSTFLHTLFWPKFAFFWPQGPRLGLKYQKHSVTSCLGPKPSISELNLVPYGNWQFWVLLTPQKPSGAPRAPQRAPEGQKRHKSSLISPIINFHAKKSHFKGVGFFQFFFTRNDPLRFYRWTWKETRNKLLKTGK